MIRDARTRLLGPPLGLTADAKKPPVRWITGGLIARAAGGGSLLGHADTRTTEVYAAFAMSPELTAVVRTL